MAFTSLLIYMLVCLFICYVGRLFFFLGVLYCLGSVIRLDFDAVFSFISLLIGTLCLFFFEAHLSTCVFFLKKWEDRSC